VVSSPTTLEFGMVLKGQMAADFDEQAMIDEDLGLSVFVILIRCAHARAR
jgi:hypothetical protein